MLIWSGEGVAMNSSSESGDVSLDGLSQHEAQQRMLAWLQDHGQGREQVNYKLRDWLFARQRYWGEPFPVIFPEGSQVCLPLCLPYHCGFAWPCHPSCFSPHCAPCPTALPPLFCLLMCLPAYTAQNHPAAPLLRPDTCHITLL